MAYKTIVGTTPFQLMYGLNALLPIEFLVPTLRVAKDLQWIGNKLSERISELEKLDETRLLTRKDVNIGMTKTLEQIVLSKGIWSCYTP